MQLTRTSEKLKRTILFNAARGKLPFVAPAQTGYFTLLLIKSGTGHMSLRTRAGLESSFPITAPMAICLRDDETVTFSMTDGDVYSVVFSPTFINVNMRPAVMEEDIYTTLAEAYHLFRLASFMEAQTELKQIEMNVEQMDTYFSLCDTVVRAMEDEDPDNCWSCRIRAGFMDILTGLEMQYVCKYRAFSDNSLSFLTYRDIVIRIHGDLMHPCRIEDVCRSFGINKNKLQRIFRVYSGNSYYDFIKKARVDRAQSYLAFTGLKLSEIAFRLGFSTEQHFYRFFHRETGIAPAEYRKTTVRNRKNAFAGLGLTCSKEDPGCYAVRS